MRESTGDVVCVSVAQRRGVSSKDINAYPCAGCGERGHLKFSKYTLRDHKKTGPGHTMLCTDCAQKIQHINGKRKLPAAWKCTCPGSARERMHIYIYIYSNEKCQLYPRRAGEKRWPGKNAGVTEEELQFKARLSERQKR